MLGRGRHDVGRRVLRSAQYGVQPEVADPLSRRGQRVRHLGPGRGSDSGRVDLAARLGLPEPADLRVRWLRPARELRHAPGRGRSLPQARGRRARAREGHPALLALALGRREALPAPDRARAGGPARSARDVRRFSPGRAAGHVRRAAGAPGRGRPGDQRGRRSRARRAQACIRLGDPVGLLARCRPDVERFRHRGGPADGG